MGIFETLGQKLEVLLSVFCGTKSNFEWIAPPPPPFLDLPPIMPYLPINIKISATPLIHYSVF